VENSSAQTGTKIPLLKPEPEPPEPAEHPEPVPEPVALQKHNKEWQEEHHDQNNVRNISNKKSSTLTPQNETPQQIKKNAILQTNETFSFKNCAKWTGGSRIDTLYKQLKSVTIALNETDYYISFGSLIGIMRDHDINPSEVDNDIVVHDEWKPSQKFKQKIWNDGLIIFFSGIYRVCTFSKKNTLNGAPWGKEYGIYTDIYNMIPNVRPRLHLPIYKGKMEYEFVKIRDIYVRIPRKDISKQLLTLGYGDWRNPVGSTSDIFYKEHGWKKRLNMKTKTNNIDKTDNDITRTPTRAVLWKKKNEIKYDTVANIMNAFDNIGIDTFLLAGSALGARRNFGWFSWDKDADLVIMCTDPKIIMNILQKLNLKFHENIDGNGKGTHGFGYHVNIPGVQTKSPYIDLWLFKEIQHNSFQCVGIENGCSRWCNKYNKFTCSLFPYSWFYPVQSVPFGPYLMPTISEQYLNKRYSETWKSKCMGWSRGSMNCVNYYKIQSFVFRSRDNSGNLVETLKKNSTVVHEFYVKDGKYILIE